MREGTVYKNTTWLEKALAPMLVLKFEKFYLFWIFGYFVSFGGTFVDLFNQGMASIIKTGIVYSTCIAIVSPLLLEFISNFISDNRRDNKEEYAIYKGWSIGICFVMLMILFLLYSTSFKTSLVSQIICFVLTLLISFYTYLVTKMNIHATALGMYKDKSYLEIENELLEKTEANSKKLTVAVTSSGNEVKL